LGSHQPHEGATTNSPNAARLTTANRTLQSLCTFGLLVEPVPAVVGQVGNLPGQQAGYQPAPLLAQFLSVPPRRRPFPGPASRRTSCTRPCTAAPGGS